jgi:hypothetical protein
MRTGEPVGLRVALEESHPRISAYSTPYDSPFVEHVGAVACPDALPLTWTSEETR